jgi:uncharacterized repeat protein (TIGR01451 family)
MQNWNRFPRVLLILSLLIALCAGMFAPRVETVEAKPLGQAATNIVISELRTRGPNGAADEFIELYNPTSSPIPIGGWELRVLTAAGAETNRATITSGIILSPGQYYLIANTTAVTGYSGSVAPNQTYTTGIVDAGGVAIFDSFGVMVDSVGLNGVNALYTEGTPLSTLSVDVNQSYERKLGGSSDSCQDLGDNSNDFQLIIPSNPQNSSTLTRLCGGNADLSITQTVDNATPIVGNTVTFTVNVSNAGTGDARNVEVKDSLPPGLTFSSTTSATQGSYSNVTGIWSVGTITNGGSATLTLVATVVSGGAKTNWAEVWSSYDQDPDSIPGNSSTTEDDDESVIITVPGPASLLNITNVVNNPTPNVGANVVFTINVNNPSTNPFGATSVNVAAALPAGLTYISSSVTVGAYNTGTGNWSIGNLAVGSGATLFVTARVTSNGIKNYPATVSSAEFSPSTATATVTPTAATQADLSLSQTWNRSASTQGIAELKITVQNNEPVNTATGVQVKALLPTGLTYVSHTPGQTYNSGTGIWAVGTLAGNTSSTLTINVRPAASGTSTTSFAEVWLSDQFDPDSTPGNGSNAEDDNDSDEVLVSDLSLTQTVDIAGSNAVFTITVTNTGPDNASGVSIKNSKLAVNTSYIYVSSGYPIGTTYDNNTGIWNIGTLASGASVTLTVTTVIVRLDENLAEVSTVIEVDPDSLPNNSSRTEDDDAGAPSADLSLTQTIISPAPYQNSELNTNVTFRITVTNAGYANATGVEVKDLLPTGLTYVVHAVTAGSYSRTSGIWTVGSLPNGSMAIMDITVKVATYGIKTNFAEVWESAQTDPDSDPGDGSTTDDDDASATVTSYRSIIFNEIAWSGTAASAEDEWIELYNPSAAEITITGWKIRKNSCGVSGTDYIVLSGKIAKEGYFLLERGNTASDNTTVFDVTANQIYLASSTPMLSNSGETLYLCDNVGNFIDTANQEGFGDSSNPWPKGSATTNYPSMERTSITVEKDSSWATNNGITKNGKNAIGGLIYGTPGRKNSTGITPTPTVVPTPTTASVIIDPRPIINEILPRPGFDWNQDGKVDVFDEFIEIKNLTAIDMKLDGWKLDKVGSGTYELPDITLKPGQRIVFYGLETNILLSDGGETVRLISPGGKIYDAYTYAIARAEDQSFCRLPDGNVYNGWFEDCTPTPNLPNTREGVVPSMPDEGYESPVCQLPDTLPADFLFAECRGYGANIWDSDYWDQPSSSSSRYIPQNTSKWEAIIE